ncbi:MAG: FG-GAP repeat protein [Bacteroidales bacterium]|nr:FG-GAP repeat protein [Bacteroidales bacterium]
MNAMHSFIFFFTLIFSVNNAIAQFDTVVSFQKISETSGNFTGQLSNEDHFSRVASIGDLDDDGIPDIAVGAFADDDGGIDRGAVWILFLNSNGTVKNHQKISSTEGNFTGILDDQDFFGNSVAGIGDLDNDNVEDIAIGASFDDDGGYNTGAVWILFLNSNGTVKNYQKISNFEGYFNGYLDVNDWFGLWVSNIGDFDNDGVADIAVGATGDSDGGGENTGALWILFLNSNGSVKSSQKINKYFGGFTGNLDPGDRFGRSCTCLGDLDGDNIKDLAVAAHFDDDGGTDRGAVWVLFMNPDGTVKSHQKISNTQGNFYGVLDDNDQFGICSTLLGDIDGDGVVDVMVSNQFDDDGGYNRGAAWCLFLNTNGTVKGFQKISDTEGNFNANLENEDCFGATSKLIGDINNDNKLEIAIAAAYDDDGGSNKGGVYIVSIESFFSPNITVDVKVYLEGPYNGTIMMPVLNFLGFLPLSHPYNTPPWNYNGTESVASIPSYNIVDWILLEIRESTGSAVTATTDSILFRRAGFLTSQGQIRDIDGTGLISSGQEAAGNLYAVVHHRNHLAVMSAFPMNGYNGIYTYDFSSGVTQALGNSSAHKNLGGGVYGMFGGDGDGDGQTQNPDKIEVWNIQSGLEGYLGGDFDMDGQVKNQDKIEVWQMNVGRGSQIVQ